MEIDIDTDEQPIDGVHKQGTDQKKRLKMEISDDQIPEAFINRLYTKLYWPIRHLMFEKSLSHVIRWRMRFCLIERVRQDAKVLLKSISL